MTDGMTSATNGFKIAQLIALVRDNQLITALVLFVLWQAGAISQVAGATGCF